MILVCNNNITRATVNNDNSIPCFNSLIAPISSDNIISAYFQASLIFNIIADTPLPNSSLSLKHDLIIRSDSTQDGYTIKSNYIDEESFGITLEEAYIDFLTSIRDKYNSLQRRETKLSSSDKAVLTNIRSLLKQL